MKNIPSPKVIAQLSSFALRISQISNTLFSGIFGDLVSKRLVADINPSQV